MNALVIKIYFPPDVDTFPMNYSLYLTFLILPRIPSPLRLTLIFHSQSPTLLKILWPPSILPQLCQEWTCGLCLGWCRGDVQLFGPVADLCWFIGRAVLWWWMMVAGGF